MDTIKRRYEFVYLFDVENGNPNGDPDAGNLPRIDPETMHGIVTDVSIKRKIRNYVMIKEKEREGYRIYVKEKAVLNDFNKEAYEAHKLTPKSKDISKDTVNELIKWMCTTFFDIRTFGAVMTTEINCGQVTGPVQINFAKSIEPIVPTEMTITRMAVTNERDLSKERTMGRKTYVPYGLYRTEGYISAPKAEKTSFSTDDLDLLWDSLINMYDHDHSAARGKMNARALIVFEHEKRLGNAPAHVLFDAVTVTRVSDKEKPARHFSDYKVEIAEDKIPEGVEVITKL
jgi:CRISPR-associated protein Csd2